MRTLPARVADAYFGRSVQSYAAGLAFNAFVTMFPVAIGLLSLLGFFVQSRPIEREVQHVLLFAFPQEAHQELAVSLRELRRHAGTLGLLSILGLVWASTGLFASLEFALNRVFDLPARSFVRRRLIGLRLIAVFTIAIMAAVLVNWAIALLQDPLLGFLGGFAGGWLVMAWLLVWIYRVAPNGRMALHEVLPGALLAGLAIEVLALAFPIFSKLTHQANTYGRGLALIFILLSWLYFLSQLLLLGAVYNRVRQELRLDLRLDGRVPDLKEAPARALVEHGDGSGVEPQLARMEDAKV